jgi:hypothetical protein
MTRILRRSMLFCAAGLLALSLPAPAKMKVKFVVPEQPVDYSKYKTYSWLPIRSLGKTGLKENDENIAPKVKAAVNAQLAAKGLREVEQGADFQIAAITLRDSTPQLEAMVMSYTPDVNWSIGNPVFQVSRYNNSGTFAMNFIDPKIRKSIFATLATDTVDNQKQGAEKLNKAVVKIFENYPPKPGTKYKP